MFLTPIGWAMRRAAVASTTWAPADAGTLLSHADGSLGSVSSALYDSIPDAGGWGLTYAGTTTTRPRDSLQCPGLAHVPSFDGDCVEHGAAKSVVKILSDGTAPYHLFVRWHVAEATGTSQAILSTTAGALASVGALLYIQGSGKLRYIVGNGSGSAYAVDVEHAMVLAGGWHTFEVAFDGTDYTLLIDGAGAVTGTGSAQSASDPSTALAVGALTTGSLPAVGHLGEILLYDDEISAGNQASLASYLDAKWSGLPGVIGLYDADSDNITFGAGSSVASWNDLAVGNDIPQAAASLQPTHSATALNGLPGIEADGTELMALTAFANGELRRSTIVSAGIWPTTGYLYDGRTSAKRNALLVSGGSPGIFAGSTVVKVTGAYGSDAFVSTAKFTGGAGSELRFDAHGSAPETATGNPGAEAMNGCTLFAARTFSSLSDGTICQHLIVDHVAAESTLAPVRDALKTEFGIVTI